MRANAWKAGSPRCLGLAAQLSVSSRCPYSGWSSNLCKDGGGKHHGCCGQSGGRWWRGAMGSTSLGLIKALSDEESWEGGESGLAG